MIPSKENIHLVLGTWELRRNNAIRSYHECKAADRTREAAINECIDDILRLLASPKRDMPKWLKP